VTSMSSLPLPDLPFQGALAFDARQQAKLPPIAAKRPPKQAPNVLLILLDDVGFGASSAFGGPVSMPTAERLAEGGLSTPADEALPTGTHQVRAEFASTVAASAAAAR